MNLIQIIEINLTWSSPELESSGIKSLRENSSSVSEIELHLRGKIRAFMQDDLPIDLRKAWVSASVLDISSEKISEPASIVKGVSSPRLFAIPILWEEKQRHTRLAHVETHFKLDSFLSEIEQIFWELHF